MKPVIVFVCISVALINGAHLPSYIKPCKRDENLSKCAKEHGNAAIADIVKGDPKYKIPNLNPIVLPKVEVQAGDNLKIALKDLIIHGLENMVLDDISFDLDKKFIEIQLSTDYLKLNGEYDIDGRILILPIKGNGPAYLNFGPSVIKGRILFETGMKDGQEYITKMIPNFSYDISKPYYHFDNLFNGDKQLGDHMNQFLNENAADVHKELSPAVSETINKIVLNILEGFLGNVPLDEILPK